MPRTNRRTSGRGAWHAWRAARNYGDSGEDFLLARVSGRAALEENLSPDAVEAALAGKPSLLDRYRQKRRAAGSLEVREPAVSAEESLRRESARETFRVRVAALQGGDGAPQVLGWLGAAYFGLLPEVGAHDDPRTCLFELVGEDEGLVEEALEVLRTTSQRDDLPSAEEVLKLARGGRYSVLKFPYLAALNELGDELWPGRPPLDEAGIRRALTFVFTPPPGFGPDPYEATWFTRIVSARPELVADSLVAATRGRGRQVDFSDRPMAALERPELAEVARLAVEPLLRRFPAHGAGPQLPALTRLIGLGHALLAEDRFLALVERKLSLKSLDAAQRAYWLAAGLLAAPESFAPRLEAFLIGRGRQRRVRRSG